jgi:hypothetical protein
MFHVKQSTATATAGVMTVTGTLSRRVAVPGAYLYPQKFVAKNQTFLTLLDKSPTNPQETRQFI